MIKQNPALRIHDAKRVAIKADGTRLPVIDSPLTTIIQPEPEDIKNGVPGDHANCMYCLACKRMFNSELVWVTRTLAYVELKGKGGNPELHRFILKSPAQKNVKGFDQNKMNVTPEAVIFAKPEGAHRLDAIASAWHKWSKRKKKSLSKRAYIKGKGPKPHEINPIQALRAPATGMFQFPHKRKAIQGTT